jgi:hypothetical protein
MPAAARTPAGAATRGLRSLCAALAGLTRMDAWRYAMERTLPSAPLAGALQVRAGVSVTFATCLLPVCYQITMFDLQC